MNILAFYAHPDDETMLAGGTLALLARLGAHVHYLSATRGEGGENGDPPLCSLEALGTVREAELRCAVAALGGETLTFLDYIDPRVGADNALFAYTDDPLPVAKKLAALIADRSIDVVFTHGSSGEYGHPAHLLTHQAALMALEQLDGQHAVPLLYAGQAAYPDHPHVRLMNSNDPADLIIDTTSVKDPLTAAALCHRTQHALFVRSASKEAGRAVSVPEVIRTTESLHRIQPPVTEPLDDPLARLLLTIPAVHRA